MILNFKTKHKTGEPTLFKEKILNNRKKHTIREDKHNRWEQGAIIHFSTGSRTKNYKQFKEGVCISTQKIKIKWVYGEEHPIIEIDERVLHDVSEHETLAENDGVSIEDLYAWFSEDFEGKIIHWTNLKY